MWRTTLVLLLVSSLILPVLASLAAYSANSYKVVKEDIVGNKTWTSLGGPYRIVKSITIEGRLVVEPGTLIEIAGGAVVTVRGELVVEGEPGKPVVFTSLGEGWILRVVGGRVEAVNTVFNGSLRLQVHRGVVKVDHFNATLIVLGPGVYTLNRLLPPIYNSTLVFSNGWIGGISYLEPPGKPAVKSSGVVLENITSLCLCLGSRESGKPYYVLGGTGFYYPPSLPLRAFSSNSSIDIENSCFILGVELGSVYYTNMSFNNSSMRELVVVKLYGSQLSITGGEIAWGRGIYIQEIYSPSRSSQSRLVVHNASIHDAIETWGYNSFAEKPIGVRIELIGGYSSENAVDLRYNWWGDPSGPYNKQVNPEGGGIEVQTPILPDIYPWLVEAPLKPPRVKLGLTVEPALPLQGVPFKIGVSGPKNSKYLYIFAHPGPFDHARILLGGSKTLYTYNYTSVSIPVERYVEVLTCSRNRLAGGFTRLEILPAPRILGSATSIKILSPLSSVVSPKHGEPIEFSAKVIVLDKNTTEKIRRSLEVSLMLNESANPMLFSEKIGSYNYSAKLEDGVYYWKILVKYAGIEIAETQLKRLVVDSTPPKILESSFNKTTMVLRIVVEDETSGVKSIKIVASISGKPRVIGGESLAGAKHKEEFKLQVPPQVLSEAKTLTIVVEDAIGNKAEYKIRVEPLSYPATKTTKSTTTSTPTSSTSTYTSPKITTTTTAISSLRATTSPKTLTKIVKQEKSPASLFYCIYNPITISIIAVVVSLLAIIVSLKTRKRRS